MFHTFIFWDYGGFRVGPKTCQEAQHGYISSPSSGGGLHSFKRRRRVIQGRVWTYPKTRQEKNEVPCTVHCKTCKITNGVLATVKRFIIEFVLPAGYYTSKCIRKKQWMCSMRAAINLIALGSLWRGDWTLGSMNEYFGYFFCNNH